MNEQKHLERLSLLEAALYSAGRPVEYDKLKKVIRTKSSRILKMLIQDLSKKYEFRRSAMEVNTLTNDRAVMRLKPQYSEIVKRVTNRPLLTSGPLRTLSFIAYNQPIAQIDVIANRGNHVYAHIKMMEEIGLIMREKKNNKSYTIKTTPYFADYFGFGHDPIKSKLALRKMFSTLGIHKIDNGNKIDVENIDESLTSKARETLISKAEKEISKNLLNLSSSSDP